MSNSQIRVVAIVVAVAAGAAYGGALGAVLAFGVHLFLRDIQRGLNELEADE